MLSGRKLSRGISRATDNEGLVWALRSGTDPDPEALSPDHIFLLPDISVYPPEFRYGTITSITVEVVVRSQTLFPLPDISYPPEFRYF